MDRLEKIQNEIDTIFECHNISKGVQGTLRKLIVEYITIRRKNAEKKILDDILSQDCDLYWCFDCQKIIVKPEEQQEDESSWSLHCTECGEEVSDLSQINWLE